MSLQVKLYTKPGCHLCADALAELQRLQRSRPFALEVVNITAEPGLMQVYGERIPVLDVDGREYDAPLYPHVLEQAIREATTV